jgi:hypothetical protein
MLHSIAIAVVCEMLVVISIMLAATVIVQVMQ